MHRSVAWQLGLIVAITVAGPSFAAAQSPPSSFTATALASNQIDLRWVDTNQNAIYTIERSVAASSGFATIATTARSATSYRDIGLLSATRYYYRARAVSPSGKASAYSSVASAVTFGVAVTATTTTSTTTTRTSTTTTTLGSSSQPPIANAGPDQLTQTLVPIAFNGSASRDPDGTITSYLWSFGDGVTGSGMSSSHAYARPGTYAVTLTVTDNTGRQASDGSTVQAANRAPVANAGPDQTATAGTLTTFSGTASYDQDGTITTYAWTFGDGTSATGPVVTHGYASMGSYTATLTVTDDSGARTSDTAIVSVTASPTSRSSWSRSFGTSGHDFPYGVATDPSGNVIVTGSVSGPTDFGGGPTCSNQSGFIAKYSSAGGLLWVRCLGGTGIGGSVTGRAIVIDGSGNIIVAGSFWATVDFGGGGLTSPWGASDIFVAKYTPGGAHVWSRRFGSGGNYTDETAIAVTIDLFGNPIVTGTIAAPVDFGGGALNTGLFLVKLSSDGAHLWSRSASATPGGVAVDPSGNVVLTGAFYGSTDFGAGVITGQWWTVFVTKYTSGGAPIWSKSGGSGFLYDIGSGIATDSAGNILVTGAFGGFLNFGNGWLQTRGGKDIFVAKLNPTGSPIWVKAFGSPYDEFASAIAVDRTGNVVVTGQTGYNSDLGGGILSGPGGDIFIAKYSATGAHLWSNLVGGTVGDYGTGIAVDTNGNISVVGAWGSPTMDPGTGPLTNAGGYDGLLMHRVP